MAASKSGAALRAEAARVLYAVRAEGRSLDQALPAAEARTAAAERPLLKHLCFEALRHHFAIRARLETLLARPLKPRDALVGDLLAVGLTQLDHTRIKPHAAVALTVEAARLIRRPAVAGLVNAVLRRHLREPAGAPQDEEAATNHPRWLLERLRADWPDDWQAIVAANNERAPMWLRVNTAKTTAAAYRERLAAAGEPPAGTLAGLPAALCLARPKPVDELPGFGEGFVSVQDGAAQLAAPWLLAGGGARILDACAAPGGKTGHLSELAPGAEIIAVDSDARRLLRVRENLARLGAQATILEGDASKPEDWHDGEPCDRILVDAPCSASGVIRRHPDIRLLRRPGDSDEFAARQLAILRALWPLVAPGGRLLYVTCSVFAAENDNVVGAFLEAVPDAREESLLPDNNIRALMRRKARGWQLLPGTGGMDGFYYALLARDA